MNENDNSQKKPRADKEGVEGKEGKSQRARVVAAFRCHVFVALFLCEILECASLSDLQKKSKSLRLHMHTLRGTDFPLLASLATKRWSCFRGFFKPMPFFRSHLLILTYLLSFCVDPLLKSSLVLPRFIPFLTPSACVSFARKVAHGNLRPRRLHSLFRSEQPRKTHTATLCHASWPARRVEHR